MTKTGRNTAFSHSAKAAAIDAHAIDSHQADIAQSRVIGRKAGIAISLAFGLFLLYGVGFAMPEVLHEAAHDARHSVAFPCH